jgi:hypothetical protein
VAYALALDPEVGGKGIRAIEEATGIAHTHLKGNAYTKKATGRSYETRRVLPDEGEVDEFGLLKCVERGDVHYRSGTFELGVYRVAHDTGQIWPSKSQGLSPSISSTPPAPGSVEDKDDHTPPRGGPDLSGIEDELAELVLEELLDTWASQLARPGVREVLAPHLDVWAPTGALGRTRQGHDGLGDLGWALALLTGLTDSYLTLDQIQRLLGLGERQTRRLVADLEKARYAERHRKGRRQLIELRFSFSLIDCPELREFILTDTERARHKSQQTGSLRHRRPQTEAEALVNGMMRQADKHAEHLHPAELEFWLRVKDPVATRLRAELVADVERGLGNFGRMLREAQTAAERPAAASQLSRRTPEEQWVWAERMRALSSPR